MSNLIPDEITNAVTPDPYVLSDDEKDALGEIGNICMGTSATTLSTLLGKKVNITTPHVIICHNAQELGEYQKPFVAVEVSYTEGVDGYNILLMKEDDVKIITDLLMGGEGVCDPDAPIDELHFSAISEVMNQMIGSASTSLSNIIHMPVNISPPNVMQIILEEDSLGKLSCHNDVTIKISFTMEIEGVLLSELMQIIPFEFGKQLAGVLLSSVMGQMEEEPVPVQPMPTQPPIAPQTAASSASIINDYNTPPSDMSVEKNRVGVKAVQYQSFGPAADSSVSSDYRENIGLIMDVPLQVTVELGQTQKSIKQILSFNVGSVIVLDRLAGEMVDVLVNGKLFAKGEVVVIEESYGVRITDIVATIKS